MDVCCQVPDDGVLPPEVTEPGPGVVTDKPYVPPFDENKPAFCGIRNPDGVDFKITGNNDNEAEYGEFPWMLVILKKDFNPSSNESPAICGASLITPLVLLTGAHCVYK